MISLTDQQTERLLEQVKSEMVTALICQHKDALDFITPAQAAGILNVQPSTLLKLPIRRHAIVPKTVVRYKLSEILAYLETVSE